MHCREIRPTSSAGIPQRGSKSAPFIGDVDEQHHNFIQDSARFACDPA